MSSEQNQKEELEKAPVPEAFVPPDTPSSIPEGKSHPAKPEAIDSDFTEEPPATGD